MIIQLTMDEFKKQLDDILEIIELTKDQYRIVDYEGNVLGYLVSAQEYEEYKHLIKSASKIEK